MMPTLIVCLFLVGRPPDVAGFVVAPGVLTVHAVLWRGARTDVCQERREVVQPLRADARVLGPVVLVRPVAGVVAAGFHVLPRLVLRRAFTPVNVVGDPGSQNATQVTSTRGGVSGSQIPATYNGTCATNTSTDPTTLSVPAISRLTKDQQVAELCACQIEGGSHA